MIIKYFVYLLLIFYLLKLIKFILSINVSKESDDVYKKSKFIDRKNIKDGDFEDIN